VSRLGFFWPANFRRYHKCSPHGPLGLGFIIYRYSSRALRKQGGQGGEFHPTQLSVLHAPWAAEMMGWRWSRGSKLVTGPLGWVAGEPDRRQRQLLCLLPVHAAGAWQVRRRVCSAHRPWPQMQVQATAARVTPRPISEIRNLNRPRSLKFALSRLFLAPEWG
jgi:hypothetical protein